MKKVGLKNSGNSEGDEGSSVASSILGNNVMHLPKTLSNLFSSNKKTGTLPKKKGKLNGNVDIPPEEELWASSTLRRSGGMLGPAMPPIAPTPRLRRINSSSLSLNKGRKQQLTLEELYVEILFSILHMIGCDAEQEDQESLIQHLKKSFCMENEKHKTLMDIARMREEPYLKANLDIMEARGLIGKDMSGSSDPFCTFYLSGTPETRFNSSYKPKTLDPIWNEDFILDVNSIENDRLRIDIWDFNPDENVTDKFKKINEIKDGRGLRKFIKETLHASTGKTIRHELIGSIEIPLKNIPSSGIQGWFPLEKPEAKTKRSRGSIKIGLTLSAEKDQNLTAQEHRHLLKILFAHEIKECMPDPFSWSGNFCPESVKILAQHAVQGKLTGAETALARWLVFAHTHCDLPLDYGVFVPILQKLRYVVDNGLFHQEEESRFFEVASVFISHCMEFIQKHRHYIVNDRKYIIQLEHIVKCLGLLCFDLEDDENNENIKIVRTIRSQVEKAVQYSIQNWYSAVLAKMPVENKSVTKIKNLTQLVHILTNNDLKDHCMQLHALFQESLNIDYLKIVFEIYETRITELCLPTVESTCDKLKPITFSESINDEESECINDTLTLGTGLFELYIALQKLVELSHEIYGGATRSTELCNCHLWFNNAVARWLDIALYKAMQRIIRAVDLDEMVPVDEYVKHTSSAVDIRTVLIQIKTFWLQLNWPDVEASYAFISKILDDVCKTTIFYADQMCKRVVLKSTMDQRGETFKVTAEMCLSINNIDYVLQYIQPFVEELGMDETISKLQALDGEEVALPCMRTLKTLVQNAVENVENKILQVLDTVGENMAPVIQKFLVEGSTLVAYAGHTKENLISYLDANMIILKEKLTDSNFDRVLSIIWDSSAQSLNDTIHLSIERRKPPSYFKILLDTLKILINFFYGDKLPQDETLLKMKNLLQLYASDSADLISRYLWERYKDQNSTKNYNLGSITIRCQMLPDHLRVEVLNARHLKPPSIQSRSSRVNGGANKYIPPAIRRRRMQSLANLTRSQRNLQWVKSKFKSLKDNLHEASVQLSNSNNGGYCDPYVSLRLVPSNRFLGLSKVKTKPQRRTLFPLFDETFDFVLPPERSLNNTYLLLTIKDRGLMGNGLFLGEALIPLSEVQKTDIDRHLDDLPQLQLPLTKPNDQESDIVLALDSRNFDRVAKDFLTKEKRKFG